MADDNEKDQRHPVATDDTEGHRVRAARDEEDDTEGHSKPVGLKPANERGPQADIVSDRGPNPD